MISGRKQLALESLEGAFVALGSARRNYSNQIHNTDSELEYFGSPTVPQSADALTFRRPRSGN